MSKNVTCDKCGGTGFLNLTPLAALRTAKSLTQTEVADHLSMGRTAYAMVENGRANMLAHRVAPLAEILEVTVEEVLSALYERPVPIAGLPENGLEE